METTHKVKIWTTEVVQGKRGASYKVRWATDRRPHKQSFKTSMLADSFRSKLLTAANEGQAFDIDTGLPLPMLRAKEQKAEDSKQKPVPLTWFAAACGYVDVKWREGGIK
jgi:hypothetical protein